MNTQFLQDVINYMAPRWWNRIRAQFPELPEVMPIEFVLSNRMTRTYGTAHFMHDKAGMHQIRLSASRFWRSSKLYADNIIPHEMAHIAAYILFDDMGHGAGWKHVCKKAGIQTSRIVTDTGE